VFALLRVAFALLAIFWAAAAAAAGYRLAPFKDDLFQYPAILQTQDDGNYVLVDYSKQRDLYGRDTIVEKKAKPEYVSLVGAATYEYEGAGSQTLHFMGTGKVKGGAKAVVIYIHGMGGSRVQGVDEWMFGGNFNRIMNLMKQNDGAYLSPDFSDFGPRGTADIRNLILDQAQRSPHAQIFIACGSWGGAICWQLAADAEAVPHISGLLLLGSNHDDNFIRSPVVTGKGRSFPVYIGHGTADPIYGWKDEVAFYNKVRAANPGYPIKVAIFRTGVHGTPIRMTDWRLILNWMLQVNGR
jgi:pimeloyl-ACP methyl ester carboxylesterase